LCHRLRSRSSPVWFDDPDRRYWPLSCPILGPLTIADLLLLSPCDLQNLIVLSLRAPSAQLPPDVLPLRARSAAGGAPCGPCPCLPLQETSNIASPEKSGAPMETSKSPAQARGSNEQGRRRGEVSERSQRAHRHTAPTSPTRAAQAERDEFAAPSSCGLTQPHAEWATGHPFSGLEGATVYSLVLYK